ncbi:MAG: ATP phosphoribosyltransferase regulatory subunit [Clostridia bacterium]|nr:ATP phosphoribosyltransferase regulatory subunit [Clostridia bacterium]
MFDESILKTGERAVFALRSLYRKYGYQPYKMSKFEEYDLYARNKDFLVSDSVITFTDTTGKLMALKPDVTLSIIKNYQDEPGCMQRVYYNENVYRISDSTHVYKEILQTGLECMGDLTAYDRMEVLRLAVESLKTISGDYVLEISHMGILSGLLSQAEAGQEFAERITTLIADKNAHEVPAVCAAYGISADLAEKLVQFIGIYGQRDKVLAELEAICTGKEMAEALAELRSISAELDSWEGADRIRFDFSLVNDMRY